MKFFTLAALLYATLCLSGCLSTEVSKSETCGVEHIYASDFGWKLFNWLPVFRSDITNERVLAAMSAEAAKRGKTLGGLVSHNYEKVMLDIPVLYVTIPIPYLFCYREVQISGVLQ